MHKLTRRAGLALSASALFGRARAAELKAGQLRIGITAEISNFDPQAFLVLNFPLIKNLYDSLIEYTPDGKPVPSLATAWTIAPDATSVTVTLRKGVTFQSGNPFNAQAVAATLQKAADPKRGKNVYATMAFVKDWTVRRRRHHPAQLQRPGAAAADHRPAAVHLGHRPGRHRHRRNQARRHRRLHARRTRRRPADPPRRQPELLARRASRSARRW